MTKQKIRDNKPDGATHENEMFYFKINYLDECFRWNGRSWCFYTGSRLGLKPLP